MLNMFEVSVSEAKSKFAEIIKQVEQGRQITVTHEGKPVARISNVKQSLPSRTALRAMQIPAKISSVETLRDMRDESY